MTEMMIATYARLGGHSRRQGVIEDIRSNSEGTSLFLRSANRLP